MGLLGETGLLYWQRDTVLPTRCSLKVRNVTIKILLFE